MPPLCPASGLCVCCVCCLEGSPLTSSQQLKIHFLRSPCQTNPFTQMVTLAHYSPFPTLFFLELDSVFLLYNYSFVLYLFRQLMAGSSGALDIWDVVGAGCAVGLKGCTAHSDSRPASERFLVERWVTSHSSSSHSSLGFLVVLPV